MGPARFSGYRNLTNILQRKYQFQVGRHQVMSLLQDIDPAGVEDRQKRRLRRRIYRCPGPNASWQIDGYDKFSKMGFCISGCIDGYSQHILYLKVGYTNHDPEVIAQYYLDCVKSVGGCPRLVQTDWGTENVIVALIQSVFYEDSEPPFNGVKSHRYGTSPSNQRIECWWSSYRKNRSEWWLNLFEDLVDSGSFLLGNNMHKLCLQYCFMEIIQKDLDEVVTAWNTHYIRKNKMSQCVSGKRDILYYLPENNGVCNYAVPVPQVKMEWAEQKGKVLSVTGNANFEQYRTWNLFCTKSKR